VSSTSGRGAPVRRRGGPPYAPGDLGTGRLDAAKRDLAQAVIAVRRGCSATRTSNRRDSLTSQGSSTSQGSGAGAVRERTCDVAFGFVVVHRCGSLARPRAVARRVPGVVRLEGTLEHRTKARLQACRASCGGPLSLSGPVKLLKPTPTGLQVAVRARPLGGGSVAVGA
jgi:hypothetical protein